jgi:dTDP-4-amino-4,6-dideoxygalactose transaminase
MSERTPLVSVCTLAYNQAYKELNTLSLPIAEKCATEILSLPISPATSNQDAIFVAETVNESY